MIWKRWKGNQSHAKQLCVPTPKELLREKFSHIKNDEAVLGEPVLCDWCFWRRFISSQAWGSKREPAACCWLWAHTQVIITAPGAAARPSAATHRGITYTDPWLQLMRGRRRHGSCNLTGSHRKLFKHHVDNSRSYCHFTNVVFQKNVWEMKWKGRSDATYLDSRWWNASRGNY